MLIDTFILTMTTWVTGYAGITNGIDVTEWDPSSDEHITSHYTVNDLSGKVVIANFLIFKCYSNDT